MQLVVHHGMHRKGQAKVVPVQTIKPSESNETATPEGTERLSTASVQRQT